jgi:hypothetical protein
VVCAIGSDPKGEVADQKIITYGQAKNDKQLQNEPGTSLGSVGAGELRVNGRKLHAMELDRQALFT